MKITIDLSKQDINLIHNAVSIFTNDCSAAYLGCESRYGNAMKEKYPDMDSFDRADMIIKHAERAKEISVELDELFEKGSNE